LHIAGIGPGTQNKLFKEGYINWQLAYDNANSLPLSLKLKDNLLLEIEKSFTALKKNNISYFLERYPNKEHWRILSHFKNFLSYFDIETTGLSIYDAEVTVVSCYHQNTMHTYINGENLDDFLDLLDDIKLLVSFNGTSFDVPFIQEYFHIPTFPCPHIDLRWICYHKNMRGSLKEIEIDCGVYRPDELIGVDGYEAVLLWEKYKRYGIQKALDKLVDYCEADVLALTEVTKEVLLR